MYIGLGALITIVILLALGRVRTERYEEPVSDVELENLLDELESEEETVTATGPSSEEEYDSE
jgi:hypothetical protein